MEPCEVQRETSTDSIISFVDIAKALDWEIAQREF
jgi:hypothetical protein